MTERPPGECSVVYVTAADREAALPIARALVAEHLVACANLLPGAVSVYAWEGAVHEEAECVLVLKTRTELVPTVVERVRALHSYDCPCVTSWTIDHGNAAYLDWILSRTTEASTAAGDGEGS